MTPPYQSRYTVGSRVRVADRARLDRFRAEWHHHHPLTPEQVAAAGLEGVVAEVGFYHGGDPLYQLADLPGLWHEPCLDAVP